MNWFKVLVAFEIAVKITWFAFPFVALLLLVLKWVWS
jgi:hypothetical protein